MFGMAADRACANHFLVMRHDEEYPAVLEVTCLNIIHVAEFAARFIFSDCFFQRFRVLEDLMRDAIDKPLGGLLLARLDGANLNHAVVSLTAL